MGMGNDGVEVSNSLKTCNQLNNLETRDVNSNKNIDDMQSENTMGNVLGTDDIDSEVSEAPMDSSNGDIPLSCTNINDVASPTREDNHTEDNYNSDIKTLTYEEKDDHCRNEKKTEQGNELPPVNKEMDVISNQGYAEGNEKMDNPNQQECDEKQETCEELQSAINEIDVTSNDGQEIDGKEKSESPDLDCQPESIPAPVSHIRNESLLRVSYMSNCWDGKRVTDIRTVTELMATIYSLEKPIIMPLPRRHEYYDQWARMPKCDVVQRLYPRVASSNVTSKYWMLYQAVQSDQGKPNNANLYPAPSPQRLAPPPHQSEVTCKSLDSIIDHYNHFLHNESAEGTHQTPPSSSTSSTHRPNPSSHNRANSSSSRSNSSSSSSNRGSSGAGAHSLKNDSSHSPSHRTKPLPLQPRKVKRISQSDAYTDLSQLATYQERSKNSPFPDYEVIPYNIQENGQIIAERPNIPKIQHNGQAAPSEPSNLYDLRQTELQNPPKKNNETISPSGVNANTGLPLPISAREFRETMNSSHHYMNNMERPRMDQGEKSNGRNEKGINTNTLSFSLPHERAQTVAEIHTQSPNSSRRKLPQSVPEIPVSQTNSNKSKLSPHDEDIIVNQGKLKIPEKHERFPLRSTAFISRSKRATTALEFCYGKTKYKHMASNPAMTPQNVHNLRESLLIHEINGDSDGSDQRKWDNPSKKRRGVSSKTKSLLQHKCKPIVQLPLRMHSMLEHHVTSERTPSIDNISNGGATSRGTSAVSLASVHFLDLADLRQLLKKSNTTLHHL